MSGEQAREATSVRRQVLAVVIALVSGVLVVVLPYALVWLGAAIQAQNFAVPLISSAGFNSSLTLLFPLVQGFALACAIGRQGTVGNLLLLSAIVTLLELVGAWVLLREGVICLIILAPMAFGAVFTGALFGHLLLLRGTSRTIQVSLAPLVALAVFAETAGPRPEHANVISDAVVINAPADVVWRYIATYPENRTSPEYWLWQLGLPYPTRSVAEAPEVGATRLCLFSTGIAFEERIVELEPNRLMVFEVTRQPDHPEVTGHFQFDRGELLLTQNADGSTTVTATSWYRLFTRPALYFDWWTADITRAVHFRVLNHIKTLAERDASAEDA